MENNLFTDKKKTPAEVDKEIIEQIALARRLDKPLDKIILIARGRMQLIAQTKNPCKEILKAQEAQEPKDTQESKEPMDDADPRDDEITRALLDEIRDEYVREKQRQVREMIAKMFEEGAINDND